MSVLEKKRKKDHTRFSRHATISSQGTLLDRDLLITYEVNFRNICLHKTLQAVKKLESEMRVLFSQQQ